MELHQVRYFLAVSRSLNFTRAAEECHVAQPSLSRAIKQLEAELGGELFRRERAMTHLTDLGRTVLPALQQCYDSTIAINELAQSFKKNGHAPLKLGLSRTIELELLSSIFNEITSAFPQIEIKVFRGAPNEIREKIKTGDIEIAIAGSFDESWERLDSWTLFEEHFGLLVCKKNAIALKNNVKIDELADERLICRSNCEIAERLLEHLGDKVIQTNSRHQVSSEEDMLKLVRENLGIGVGPTGKQIPNDIVVREIEGIELNRNIKVFVVAGRQQSIGAKTMIKLIRAADWQNNAVSTDLAEGQHK